MKRTFRIVLYAVIILAFFFLISTYFFLKSPSFPKRVGEFISSHSGRPVEIGSISLAKGQVIVIRDVIIRDPDSKEPFIVLPSVEIKFSLSELLNKKIDRIAIKKPKVFLALGKDKGPEKKESKPSLPFSFNKISIEDGEVIIIQTEADKSAKAGKPFRVSAINLSLEETDDKKTEIKGSVFLNEINLTVPLRAVIDTEELDIEKGHIDITLKKLESKYFEKIPLLKDREIKGSADLSIDIYREDRLGIQLKGHFHNLEVRGQDKPLILKNASGELQVLIMVSDDYQDIEIKASGVFNNPLWGKEDSHKAVFNGTYDVKAHELKIENASLSSSIFGSMDIDGRLENFPSKNPGFTFNVEGKAIPIHEIKKVLSGSAGELIEKADIKGYGKVVLSISGNLKPHLVPSETEVPYQIIGRADIGINHGGFSSSDGTMAGEGIDMNVLSTFKFSLPLNTAEFTINAQAADFELLIGSFYGDFTDSNVSFSLEGKYTKSNNSIKVSRSELSLRDIGTVLVSGEISNLTESPHFNTEIHLRELINKRAYDFFLRETFQDSLPILSQLEISGTTSMILSLEGTLDRINAHGEINVVDMDIIGKSPQLSVNGVSLSLPIDISYPKSSFSKETEHFGSLKIQSILCEDLHCEEFQAFPAIWQNALVFKEDISIPVFGGNVRLKSINYKDLFSPERKLTLSISIDDIDLEQVSTSLKIPKFSGNLSGVIPEASIVGSSLRTEGEIVMELFGGEIRMKNLSVNNVFGPVPSIEVSVEIQDIDLGMLTETFEFGHISGIMQGYVRDLVITDGQAESFEAFIETVRKDGVSQKINVDALKKISILGTGSASVLNSGIYQFFKEYRYKKIGFKGFLKNDKFILLGVESEGNKEYLVKGGFFPPKVDVINYTREVSFQEMIKRLKRIK